jgi:hypothetical protein
MILKASDRSSALGGGLGGISLENHFARRTYIYRKFAPEPLFVPLLEFNHLRLLRFLTATRCLKSSDRPCAFGADLLNDRIGSEIGQEQRGDEHGAEDGFDAI